MPRSVPPSFRLVVDWMHIREAERRGRTVTPFGLALVEQTRFSAGQVSPECILLIDGVTGTEVRYAAHAELADYQRRFALGQAVAPATFTLELKLDP